MNVNLENKIVEKVKYRDLKGLNYSAIKLFDESRIDFYRQMVLGEKPVEKSSYSLQIGTLVDFALLECRADEKEFELKFDEYYTLYTGVKGSGQDFLLADEIFKLTKRDIVDGEITTDFEYRFKEAFETLQKDGKFKGKTWDKGLESFNKTAKEYFDSLMQNISKEVVSLQDLEKAKSIVNTLVTDDITKDIFKGNDDLEYLTKFVIEWKYKGFDCKSELDAILISHSDKTIQPVDLKSTYTVDEFQYNYLKYGYYLQQAFYYLAVQYWAEKNNLDYEILPLYFVVCDTSKNNQRPLIYKLTKEHIMEGLKGFTTELGYKYRGIEELVDEINWCNENQIWNISKENYENNGIVNLKTFNKNR
jgi:hypothetical protein